MTCLWFSDANLYKNYCVRNFMYENSNLGFQKELPESMSIVKTANLHFINTQNNACRAFGLWGHGVASEVLIFILFSTGTLCYQGGRRLMAFS